MIEKHFLKNTVKKIRGHPQYPRHPRSIPNHPRSITLYLLRLTCSLIFLGWAWLHFLGDIPFRAIFWDEGLLKGLVEGLTTLSWNDWVTSLAVDRFVQNLIYATGGFYLICIYVSLRIQSGDKWYGRLLLFGALSLTFLAFLFCKEKFFHIGQFFEYTIQWSTPVLLFLMMMRGWDSGRLLRPMKIAIALTFVCHGLYAVGFYPIPGNFVDMLIGIFNLSEPVAQNVLTTVGIIDFLVGILIFLPGKWALPALGYAVLWGTATALARITGYLDFDFFMKTVLRWLPETILRLSHGLLPFIAMLIIWEKHGQIPRIIRTLLPGSPLKP